MHPGRWPGKAFLLRRLLCVMPPVVDSSWLRSHRDDVVLADVRWYLDGRSGRAAYDEGHLPGAVHIHFEEVEEETRYSGGARPPEVENGDLSHAVVESASEQRAISAEYEGEVEEGEEEVSEAEMLADAAHEEA